MNITLYHITILNCLLQVRSGSLGEVCGHYIYQKPASQHTETKQQVQKALQRLVSSGRVIDKGGIYYPSFKQPGKYKLDLSGEVNVLRHPLVKALQQHPGIAGADIDEHFIKTHQPAWYEIGTRPNT